MSHSPLASDFGKQLKITIIHLIKNDAMRPFPAESVETAKLLEAFQWDDLPADEKKARVETVWQQFGPGSPVEEHFRKYPECCQFSKQKYAEFIASMTAYRAELAQ